MPSTSPQSQPHPLFSAADHVHDGKHHILLAATGSVATIKLPLIARALSTHHATTSVRLLLTPSATNFLQSQSAEQPSLSTLLALPGIDSIHEDADDWAKPWVRGDKILHIELRRWAHVLVVAPLSANSLAKIVGGLCDGLLMSVVRAWDTTGLVDGVGEGSGGRKRKRIFVAPAMNTAMWRHPVTRKQIRVLEEEWGGTGDGEDGDRGDDGGEGQAGLGNGWITVLRPMEKELACGDVGDGAMMDWGEIVGHVERYLGLGSKVHMNGKG
jgi:phosphopantothenoylcysteine decarboxylase